MIVWQKIPVKPKKPAKAQLEAIVRVVALTRIDGICPYCRHTIDRHTATCIVTQARLFFDEA